MNWTRITPKLGITARLALLATPLLALPVAGHAITQVAGPVQIGPSSADGNEQNRSATLSTTITNQGGLPDRLVNVACPGIGNVALVNGQVQPVDPGAPGGTVQRNGLELPGALDRPAMPVQAQFNLTDATQPMRPGSLIPCALYFLHAGQRIVIFSLGTHGSVTDEP